MTSQVDQERLQQLLRRHGGSDREIAALLDVDPSTVWRLRHRKIAKVTRYLQKMSLEVGNPPQDGERAALADLLELADQSPALRAVLIALRDFLQEDAGTAAR